MTFSKEFVFWLHVFYSVQGEWIPQSKALPSSCAPIPLPVWRHGSTWIPSCYLPRRRRNGQPIIVSQILYTHTVHLNSRNITECLEVTFIKIRLRLSTCSPDKNMNCYALGFYYFYLEAALILLQTFSIGSSICLFLHHMFSIIYRLLPNIYGKTPGYPKCIHKLVCTISTSC